MRYGLSLLGGLILQALPRQLLLQGLARRGPQGVRGACPAVFFSGRVALAALAGHASFTRRVALVPSYLCNVVPMAFERAGWRCVGYGVDEQFVPDSGALRRLAETEGADLLLLAPLYGSEGGLADWLADEAHAWRERHGVALVLDLCQDAARLSALLRPPGRRWAAVLSFNDKSFPGVMGACVWTDLDLPSPGAPPWRQRSLLMAWALRKVMLPARRANDGEAFEHSRAERFPYAFEPRGASSLQLALGAIGLHSMPSWMARRRAAWARGEVRALTLPFAATAPFVVALPGDRGVHRRKRPYATADDPARSLRPELTLLHNKGFDDR